MVLKRVAPRLQEEEISAVVNPNAHTDRIMNRHFVGVLDRESIADAYLMGTIDDVSGVHLDASGEIGLTECCDDSLKMVQIAPCAKFGPRVGISEKNHPNPGRKQSSARQPRGERSARRTPDEKPSDKKDERQTPED
jgi:hypothetical protein